MRKKYKCNKNSKIIPGYLIRKSIDSKIGRTL